MISFIFFIWILSALSRRRYYYWRRPFMGMWGWRRPPMGGWHHPMGPGMFW